MVEKEQSKWKVMSILVGRAKRDTGLATSESWVPQRSWLAGYSGAKLCPDLQPWPLCRTAP